MTAAQRKALQIIKLHGPVTAYQFARLMWPDSPGHKRRSNRHGNIAGAYGTGITRKAGAFLMQLTDAKLLVCHSSKIYQHTWDVR